MRRGEQETLSALWTIYLGDRGMVQYRDEQLEDVVAKAKLEIQQW